MTTSKEAVLSKLNDRLRHEHAAETEKAIRAGRQPAPEPVPLRAEQVEFPKWVYRGWKPSSKGAGNFEPSESRLVNSVVELEALGNEWSEEPRVSKGK